MVTTTTRKLVSIDLIKQMQQDGLSSEEIVKRCSSLEPRHKNPPAPPGSLSIGEASRKYGIAHATIWRWVDKGMVPVVLRTTRYKYIDEKVLADVVARYKACPGQGKRTLETKKKAQ